MASLSKDRTENFCVEGLGLIPQGDGIPVYMINHPVKSYFLVRGLFRNVESLLLRVMQALNKKKKVLALWE